MNIVRDKCCDDLGDTERKTKLHLKITAALLPIGALLIAFDIIHWAIWIPALIANAGLVISLSMKLNRIDELRNS